MRHGPCADQEFAKPNWSSPDGWGSRWPREGCLKKLSVASAGRTSAHRAFGAKQGNTGEAGSGRRNQVVSPLNVHRFLGEETWQSISN